MLPYVNVTHNLTLKPKISARGSDPCTSVNIFSFIRDQTFPQRQHQEARRVVPCRDASDNRSSRLVTLFISAVILGNFVFEHLVINGFYAAPSDRLPGICSLPAMRSSSLVSSISLASRRSLHFCGRLSTSVCAEIFGSICSPTFTGSCGIQGFDSLGLIVASFLRADSQSQKQYPPAVFQWLPPISLPSSSSSTRKRLWSPSNVSSCRRSHRN